MSFGIITILNVKPFVQIHWIVATLILQLRYVSNVGIDGTSCHYLLIRLTIYLLLRLLIRHQIIFHTIINILKLDRDVSVACDNIIILRDL